MANESIYDQSRDVSSGFCRVSVCDCLRFVVCFIFLPNSSGVNFKVRTGVTNDFNEGSGLFGS